MVWSNSGGWLLPIHECAWHGVTCDENLFTDSLSLENNGITGTLPTELGNLNSLLELTLYNNAITGTLPTELGNLNELEYLYLYNNAITGTLPTELGNLNELFHLFLYCNSINVTESF